MATEHREARWNQVPRESTVIVQKYRLTRVWGCRLVDGVPEGISDAHATVQSAVLEVLRPDRVESALIRISPEVRIDHESL